MCVFVEREREENKTCIYGGDGERDRDIYIYIGFPLRQVGDPLKNVGVYGWGEPPKTTIVRANHWGSLWDEYPMKFPTKLEASFKSVIFRI